MSVKAVVPNLDGVPEALRPEYKEREGKFYLDLEGIDDHDAVGTLKRAKDYEKENARKAKDEVRQLTTELDNLRTEMDELRKNGIPKGDVDKLEQSYKEKFAKKETELNDKIKSLGTSLERHLLDNDALKLATDIAAKPEYIELLMPHIRTRMKLESSEDGEQVVRILDKDGKPSAFNLDDLKKELLGNKSFAAILSGSKAGGGGAANGNSGNGGGASKKLSELTEAERVTMARENPDELRRLTAESQQQSAARR